MFAPQLKAALDRKIGETTGSEEVKRLRYIRDNVLNLTPEGQEITRLYCVWSPLLVKTMEVNEGFGEELKTTIDGILILIRTGIE